MYKVHYNKLVTSQKRKSKIKFSNAPVHLACMTSFCTYNSSQKQQ